jgi:serine O-acetyltransferase
MFDNLRQDIQRFQENEDQSFRRAFVAGLLSPGFQALAVYRFLHCCHERNIPTQPLRYLLERLVEITTGISLPAKCRIGKGCRILHFGNLFLHSSTWIGEQSTLYHEVTVGDRDGSGRAARIGDRVFIGAGAKIIGEISIGDDCIIGANAVVTKDMPSRTVAYGNPAVYKPRSGLQEAAASNG